MTKNGNETGRRGTRATIKMPKPLSAEERLQAQLLAAGFSPDQIKINTVQTTTDGQGSGTSEITMSLNLPHEAAERLIKLLTIKPFDPDKDTVTIGNGEAKLLSEDAIPETKPAVKLWTGNERSKRSKPKSDVPDLT